MLDVREWQKLEDELEVAKAMKKMRMLYGHMTMWEEKMREIKETDSPEAFLEDGKENIIDDPLPAKDINRKQDRDFVYF